MAQMSDKDFIYYTNFAKEMKNAHKKDWCNIIRPDTILQEYEGVANTNSSDSQSGASHRHSNTIDSDMGLSGENQIPNKIKLNNLFPTTNTLLPELYPANPKFLATPKNGYNANIDISSSKVMTEILNYYVKEKGMKPEVEDSILNAFFFGYAGIKQGWHAEFKKSKLDILDIKETLKIGLMDKFKMFMSGKNQSNAPIPPFGDSETFLEKENGPFFVSVSPEYLILDHTQKFNKGKRLIHLIPVNLNHLKESNLYETNNDFFSKFGKSVKDDRDINITINEMWIQDKNDIWIFAFVDEWDKPLRWEKWGSVEEGFPFELLTLNREPKVTYPISHARVAIRSQRQLDYINTLAFRTIDRWKNLTIINEDIFTDKTQAKNIIEENPLGGVIYSKRSAGGGDVLPIVSTPPPRDIFNISSVLEQNIREILTVTGSKVTGSSETDTATEAQIAEGGNVQRTSGMKKYIEEWLTNIGKRLAQQIKQFDTEPKIIKITGIDIRDPETGEIITDKWVSFGQDGFPQIRETVQGEYDLDIDFTEALPKNLPVIRKQLIDIVGVMSQLEPILNKQGKTFDAAEYAKTILSTFETINNADKFIKDLNMGLPSPIEEGIPLESSGLPQGPEIPSVESIIRGAQSVPTGTNEMGMA